MTKRNAENKYKNNPVYSTIISMQGRRGQGPKEKKGRTFMMPQDKEILRRD